MAAVTTERTPSAFDELAAHGSFEGNRLVLEVVAAGGSRVVVLVAGAAGEVETGLAAELPFAERCRVVQHTTNKIISGETHRTGF